ncbi:fimbria/pilus outer membrane usher protein [Halobacteriovorax sp. DPLXC-1]|uniref:fimbria/pilus outer membrane usher protein n=1 Tax=Halobacteriovorax sp. DPLXC-1 TaxID=3110771 RepID=UPI002FF4102B
MAQSQNELFKSVFGESVFETYIEFVVQGKSLGDIEVKASGPEIKAYNSKVLNAKLRLILKDESFKRIDISKKWVDAKSLPYKLIYDSKTLKVILDVEVSDLRPIFYSLEDNPKLKYAGQEIRPAPLAGSINYLIDKTYGDEYFGGEKFSLNIKSFINVKSYVLEMNGFYDESSSSNAYSEWSRRDFSLTKDFESIRMRTRLGDTTTGRLGFMQAKSIGGINIRKQFSIDPYETPYSQGEKEFQITSRSSVRTYVNGSLVKSEILPAGNYKLSKLPLVNGMNNVRIEIDNGSGVKQILEFDIPSSVSVLKAKEIDYSLSAGRLSDDSGVTRSYFDEDFYSGFLQYGVNDWFTTGAYFQNDDEFLLAGLVNGTSTVFGNFFLGNAFSNNSDQSDGVATALTWQYQDVAGVLLENFSFTLRYENFINSFRSSSDLNLKLLRNNYQLNLAFPLFRRGSINIGAGISEFKDIADGERNFIRSSINYNPIRNLNLSIYASRTKDSVSGVDNSVSAFLTWSIPADNRYISAFHDFEDKTSRLSYTQDNSSELYNPRYTISVDDDTSSTQLGLSSNMPTPMADFFLRGRYARTTEGDSYRHIGIGLSTTTLFAYDNGFGFAQSRTNTNSFAIFKTSDEIDDQNLIIKSTSSFADTRTPLLGDLAITDMVAYQYRDVQLDPSSLNLGTSLEKEKYILFPTYKSGHLINVNDNGLFSLKGVLLRNGKPVSLEVCQLGDQVFFTDRDGSFFIAEVNPDDTVLKVSGKRMQKLNIANGLKGIINIGEIHIK